MSQERAERAPRFAELTRQRRLFERRRVRLALAAVLLASFFGASKAWECYFARLFDRAFATVKAAGAHPYTGPRQHYHMGWHSVWCGLGDFAQDRGYDWDDNAAKDYARPTLEE